MSAGMISKVSKCMSCGCNYHSQATCYEIGPNGMNGSVICRNCTSIPDMYLNCSFCRSPITQITRNINEVWTHDVLEGLSCTCKRQSRVECGYSLKKLTDNNQIMCNSKSSCETMINKIYNGTNKSYVCKSCIDGGRKRQLHEIWSKWTYYSEIHCSCNSYDIIECRTSTNIEGIEFTLSCENCTTDEAVF